MKYDPRKKWTKICSSVCKYPSKKMILEIEKNCSVSYPSISYNLIPKNNRLYSGE
jgi:hypothetical protein